MNQIKYKFRVLEFSDVEILKSYVLTELEGDDYMSIVKKNDVYWLHLDYVPFLQNAETLMYEGLLKENKELKLFHG